MPLNMFLLLNFGHWPKIPIPEYSSQQFPRCWVKFVYGGQNYTIKTIMVNFQSQQSGKDITQIELFLFRNILNIFGQLSFSVHC